jgi:hypothetical protein
MLAGLAARRPRPRGAAVAYAMNSPLLPAGLFMALVVSISAAVPLADAAPALAIVALFGAVASLAGLIFVVLRADLAYDPRRHLTQTLESFDERWPKFERDFWAHVDSKAAAHKLD